MQLAIENGLYLHSARELSPMGKLYVCYKYPMLKKCGFCTCAT